MADKQGWQRSGAEEALTIIDLGEQLVVGTTALERRQSMTIDSVQQLDRPMRHVSSIITFGRCYRGDLMNLAETLFGEEAAQIVDSEHLTEAEAAAEKYVASHVKPTTRAHAQSWEHMRAVADLKDEEQAEWLDRSRAESWSAGKLANEIRASKAGEGKTVMRFWLVVECGTEARRDKLADELGPRGYTVKRQEKLSKVAKPKKARKGPVTAQKKHKGTPKRNTRKRPPK